MAVLGHGFPLRFMVDRVFRARGWNNVLPEAWKR